MPRKGGTTASLVPPPPGPFPRAAERMYEVDLSNWQTNKRRPSRVIIYSAYTGSNLRKGMLRAWWDLQNYGGAFHRYQRMLRRHHLLPVDDYISRTELERPHQIIQPLRRALLLVVAYNRSTRKPVGMLSRGLWKPRTPRTSIHRASTWMPSWRLHEGCSRPRLPSRTQFGNGRRAAIPLSPCKCRRKPTPTHNDRGRFASVEGWSQFMDLGTPVHFHGLPLCRVSPTLRSRINPSLTRDMFEYSFFLWEGDGA